MSDPLHRAPTNLVEASTHLRRQFEKSTAHRDPSPEAAQALRTYKNFVHRDLVEPLQAWAMAQEDPVVRNAGFMLAEICDRIHRLSAELQEMQECPHSRMNDSDGKSNISKAHLEYVQMCDRFRSLALTIVKLRESA